MPDYDYRCSDAACGTRWSENRSIATRHDAICPTCGKAAVIVIIKAPHLGWYAGAPRPNFREPRVKHDG